MIEIALISETEVYAVDSPDTEAAGELKYPEISGTEQVENSLESAEPSPEEEAGKEVSALGLVVERLGGTAEDWKEENIEGPETFFRDGEVFYADGRSLTAEIRECGNEFAVTRHEEMLQALESQNPYVFDGTLENTHYGMVVKADEEGRLTYENFSHLVKEAKEIIYSEDDPPGEKLPEAEGVLEEYSESMETATETAAEKIVISLDDAFETEAVAAAGDAIVEAKTNAAADISAPDVADGITEKTGMTEEAATAGEVSTNPVTGEKPEKSADAAPAEKIVSKVITETEPVFAETHIAEQITAPMEPKKEDELKAAELNIDASSLHVPDATDKVSDVLPVAGVNESYKQETIIVPEASSAALEAEENIADAPQEEKQSSVPEKIGPPLAETISPARIGEEKAEAYVKPNVDIPATVKNSFVEVRAGVKSFQESGNAVPGHEVREHKYEERKAERAVAAENMKFTAENAKTELQIGPGPKEAGPADKKEEAASRPAEIKTAPISGPEAEQQTLPVAETFKFKTEVSKEAKEDKKEDKTEENGTGAKTPRAARAEAGRKPEASGSVKEKTQVRSDEIRSSFEYLQAKPRFAERPRVEEAKIGPATILRFMGVPQRTAVAMNTEAIRDATGRSYSSAGTAFNDDKVELWRERDEESGITILRSAA